MSDSKKGKLETTDKIIISIICLLFILAIIGTIWWVRFKANREIKNIVSNYENIQYSSYKYNIKDNNIYFYKDIKEVAVYKCVNGCYIEKVQSEQFIFDNENLILIKDDSKYLIYDVLNKKTLLTLDEYPKALSVIKYGYIYKSNKYGIIDEKGKVIYNFEFDNIDSIDDYVFVVKNDKLIVLDSELKTISQQQLEITNLDDFVLISKNNKITIVITSKNSSENTFYRFNTDTNKFID